MNESFQQILQSLNTDTADEEVFLEWCRLSRSGRPDVLPFSNFAKLSSVSSKHSQVYTWMTQTSSSSRPITKQERFLLQCAAHVFVQRLSNTCAQPMIRNYHVVLQKLCHEYNLHHVVASLKLPKSIQHVHENEQWYKEVVGQFYTRAMQRQASKQLQEEQWKRYQIMQRLRHSPVLLDEEEEKYRPPPTALPVYVCCTCDQPAPYPLHGPICCPWCRCTIVEKRLQPIPCYFIGTC